MHLPFGVLAIYGALVVWATLLVLDLKRLSFGRFLGFGITPMLVLNVRAWITELMKSAAKWVFCGLRWCASRTRCASKSSTMWIARNPRSG